MKAFLAVLVFFVLSTVALGSEFIQLDEVAAQYDRYIDYNYSPYIDGAFKDGLSLKVDSTVGRYFYWNSTVHGAATESQYRFIGLQMDIGIRLAPFMDLGLEHHSQHVLDEGEPFGRPFPTQDTVQLKIYFYRADTKETLLK